MSFCVTFRCHFLVSAIRRTPRVGVGNDAGSDVDATDGVRTADVRTDEVRLAVVERRRIRFRRLTEIQFYK